MRDQVLQEKYSSKLRTADEAVRMIRSEYLSDRPVANPSIWSMR